ncbi:MAG: hypothetical protein ABJA81_12675, partial [Nocardioidaceae bacterium]
MAIDTEAGGRRCVACAEPLINGSPFPERDRDRGNDDEVLYRRARLIVELLLLRGRRDRSKDAEIVVLGHQLAVRQRQAPDPSFEPADRVILTALSR